MHTIEARDGLRREVDRAYDDISLGEVWGVLSCLVFFLTLSTRQVVRLLPFSYRFYASMPPLAVWLVPAFSLIGILLALFGGRRRVTARLGLFANTIAFFVGSTLILLILLWRRLG